MWGVQDLSVVVDVVEKLVEFKKKDSFKTKSKTTTKRNDGWEKKDAPKEETQNVTEKKTQQERHAICFVCGNNHFARDCRKQALNAVQAERARIKKSGRYEHFGHSTP